MHADPRQPLSQLQTHSDLQQCVRDLFRPLRECFSAGGARVRLGITGTGYSPVAEELEGFSRPLWGVAALSAGGGKFEDWPLYLRGLDTGTDPQHPEYWGSASHQDQRLVEMAGIAFALLVAPRRTWDPLAPEAKQRLAAWLNRINEVELFDNNWRFFRVLVNLALARTGSPHNAAKQNQDLERLEEFYLGDGWYSDGADFRCDYYVAFAFHFYSLIYARHAAQTDPDRARRFRQRAASFAEEYIHLFAAA